LAGDAGAEWLQLARLLAGRQSAPPLFLEIVDHDAPARLSDQACLLPAALAIARSLLEDQLEAALDESAADEQSVIWRAVALRRAGRYQEARRAFRQAGAQPEYPQLLGRALEVFRSGGGGFRWAAESAAHLTVRGRWDPIWFVDACEAARNGLLSRESEALLQEIQRAELQLLLDTRAAG
jgi:tetratricopeptide (TPR) repeat protein